MKGQDAKDIHKNLLDYITKFSGNVRDIFLEKFLFTDQLKRLNDAGLLYQVFDRFTQIATNWLVCERAIRQSQPDS